MQNLSEKNRKTQANCPVSSRKLTKQKRWGDKMGLLGLFPIAVLTTRFNTTWDSISQGALQYIGDPKRKKSVWESLDKRLKS
jgi:hypothetical protein